MVMSSTRAVLVSIHAVSPELKTTPNDVYPFVARGSAGR
jgi:hypothetical protein